MENETFDSMPAPVRSRRRSRRGAQATDWYDHSTLATEVVLYCMIVFSPWAFGTTQPWSIWTMNIGGYLLGALFAFRLLCRRLALGSETEARSAPARWPTVLCAALTVALLGYCLIAAFNARANLAETRLTFTYFEDYVKWLPHSYSKERTFAIFWNYLALAFTFWAVHDWLRSDQVSVGRKSSPPSRLKRLLWVLAVNGAALAFQGLMQRVGGEAKLLWFMETRINRIPDAQFGPYAYRSNAAQYFLLLWPLMLAFWWWLEQSQRNTSRGRMAYRVLVPLTLLVAICPIITLSRAGAVVTLTEIVAVTGVILASSRAQRRLKMGVIGGAVAVIAGLAMYFNGDELLQRFETSAEDYHRGREVTYQIARKMLQDYPVYGTGPGTFEDVFQLYRTKASDYWPTQLHNDWLEIMLTFGYVGFSFIAALLLLVLTRWFVGRRRRGHDGADNREQEPLQILAPWHFAAMLWISIGGCLIYARVDFPFQIYSTTFLAILVCAILFSISRRRSRA